MRHLTFEQLEPRCATAAIVSLLEDLMVHEFLPRTDRHGVWFEITTPTTPHPAAYYAEPVELEPYVAPIVVILETPEDRQIDSQLNDQLEQVAWFLASIPQPTHPVIEEPEEPDDMPQPTHPVIEEPV